MTVTLLPIPTTGGAIEGKSRLFDPMEASAEQTAALKQRIRRLERALAESEALTLAQIECTKRLEQQLQEQQRQLEERDQKLQQYQAAPLATAEAHHQHIQELHNLIWELERRPTLEQHQLLKQQCENHQLEIETLKQELQRRPDPVRIFELQQEIAILKEYTQHLTDRSTNVIQLQQKYLELRSQYSDLEKELERLRQQVVDQAVHPDAGGEQVVELRSQLQSQEREFSFVLAEMASLREQHQQTCQALETLQVQYEAQVKANQELQQALDTMTADKQELSHWQTANQQLSLELASTRYELEQLRHDAIDPQQLRQVQEENRHLRAQLETLQALQQQQQTELQQQKLDRAALQFQLDQTQPTLQALQAQVAEMQAAAEQQATQYAAQSLAWQQQAAENAAQLEHLQGQLQEKEALLATLDQHVRDYTAALEAAQQQLSQLPAREQWQDMVRQRELLEAHQVVSKKQIEQLQQQIAELKTECVQAHATISAQEKDIALLEKAKQDLELQLYAAQNHSPHSASTLSQDLGIPPFSVDATVPPLPRPSQPVPQPITAPLPPAAMPATSRARVELPAFVRRR